MAALSRGVYIVETGGLGYRNTVAAYIVAGERSSAIIDTGYASSARRVASAIVESGASQNLRYIIPTHAHLDHCGATGDLASIFAGAEVYTHERALPHLINPSRLLEGVKSIYEAHVFSAMGGIRPLDESRSRVMDDGEEIDLGGMTIRSIYTHGHAPHHLSIQIIEKGYVVTGDAVPSRYPFTDFFIPNTVPPKYDLDQALKSIRKIFELEPRLLLTPHYGPILPSHSLRERYEQVIKDSVELAKKLISRGAGIEELRSSLTAYLAGHSDLSKLHPYIQSAISLAALALYQTYKSST
ncbi:MAG: MBL fold metallo-hydrolase [Nitrososphaerota archaeon]|nr:MBL fold metallo-hydrolase [Candidatus Calditenuaceae archaeon]MDW8074042.1 MBL fold metallo-hydrolase [Nitrososphaerota archaeon]